MPWVFARGEPSRNIAALELLGTLVCLLEKNRASSLVLAGDTDNKGNSHLVDRMLTTKFPLRRLDGASGLGTEGLGRPGHVPTLGAQITKLRSGRVEQRDLRKI